MALVTCYECGEKISDLTMACPHCGAPVRKIVAVSPQTQSVPDESKPKVSPHESADLHASSTRHKPFTKPLSTAACSIWFLALVFALSFTTAAKAPDLLSTIINSVLGACLYLAVGWVIALFLTMIKKRELPSLKQTLWAGTVITAITLFGQVIHPSVISAIQSNVARIEAEKVANTSPAETALSVVSAPTTQDIVQQQSPPAIDPRDASSKAEQSPEHGVPTGCTDYSTIVIPANYSGARISFNFENVPIRSFLQLIAQDANKEIIPADDVNNAITICALNIPWDYALAKVLADNGYGQIEYNGAIRVFKL